MNLLSMGQGAIFRAFEKGWSVCNLQGVVVEAVMVRRV